MSISPINNCTSVARYNYNASRNVSMRANSGGVNTNDVNENSNGRKWLIGLGAVAVLVTLFALGKKGHLGTGVKDFLNGSKKSASNAADTFEHSAAHQATNAATSTTATPKVETVVENTVKPEVKNPVKKPQVSNSGQDVNEVITSTVAGKEQTPTFTEAFSQMTEPPKSTGKANPSTAGKSNPAGGKQQKTHVYDANEAENIYNSRFENQPGEINRGYDSMPEYNRFDSNSGYGTEIDEMNRGLFGQDRYDPTNPLNEMDMLSPYYKDPYADLNSSFNSTTNHNPYEDDSIFGFGI